MNRFEYATSRASILPSRTLTYFNNSLFYKEIEKAFGAVANFRRQRRLDRKGPPGQALLEEKEDEQE